LIILTIVTFLSRLTLFLGIKHIGGIQTAIIGLGELLITILLSFYFLHETLTLTQMTGAAILGASILLVSLEKHNPDKHHKGGWLAWIHPPEVSVPWSLQE
jgi:drug/metabolite transporter (DMT)-like permease